MKPFSLILSLSVLLLTSSCVSPDKDVKPIESPKLEAVAISNQKPMVVYQLGIDDSINTDDPKIKELQPFGPENAINVQLEHMINLNEGYKEIAVSYMVDYGTNVAPYVACSLYKKDSKAGII